MISLQLDILNERALDVIRYLEKVQDIRIIPAGEFSSPEHSTSNEPSTLKPENSDLRQTPSPTSVKTDPSLRTRQNYFGALAQAGNTSAMEQYFNQIREEWEDRI